MGNYKLIGYKTVSDNIIEGYDVYKKYADTLSSSVITNLDTDERLNTVLSSIQNQISNISTQAIPIVTGQSGKFLSTDGTDLKWDTVDVLPSQTGNSGKYLKTNGVSLSWDTATTLTLTSTTVPLGNSITGSYGTSTEAARADHIHPFNINYIETNISALGGERAITLNPDQWPDESYFGISVYRSGLYLTKDVDYTVDASTKTITLERKCVLGENISILIGTIMGSPKSNSSTNLTNTVTPLMSGTPVIGASTEAARADHIHPKDTSKADINSPIFTGIPTVPTAEVNTSTTQIASTEFVLKQINASASSISLPNQTGNSGKFLTTNGTSPSWGNPLPIVTSANPGQALILNSNKEPVWENIANELPTTVFAKEGQVLTLDSNKSYVWKDIPTEIPSIANQVSKILYTDGTTLSWIPNSSVTQTVNPVMSGGSAFLGTSTEAARADHRHPSDSSKASLDSPVFVGTPKSTTPEEIDNSERIATTAFVNKYYDKYVMQSDQIMRNNSDVLYTLKNTVETVQNLGEVNQDISIDFALGNIVKATVLADISLNFEISSSDNLNCRTITLVLSNANNYVLTWPENIHWHNNAAPVLTSFISIINLITLDNGNTYYGFLFGNFV